MPYNTRRKSLSLPSLGIHVPVTHAARAAAASKNAARLASSSSSTSAAQTPSRSPDLHPSKRLKRFYNPAGGSSVSSATSTNNGTGTCGANALIEHTPPPSPKSARAPSIDMPDADQRPVVDLEGINDDIVEASILQLQATPNRPHLIKELATVLSQKLTSVQQSANPSAIISSRLTSYMKRPCWTAVAPCPLAKELETVHPRRTYFFLATCPRQPIPDPGAAPIPPPTLVTPSVSLTDDSGSDDFEARRRDLSPSSEVDLASLHFDYVDDEAVPPLTHVGSFASHHVPKPYRVVRNDSPPLEKDEREFTQTADVLQKRKLSDVMPALEPTDRLTLAEYGYQQDLWLGENRTVTFLPSPLIKPSLTAAITRKEDEADAWLRLSDAISWSNVGAESIEIDELDMLLEGC